MPNISQYVTNLGKKVLCLISASGLKRFQAIVELCYKTLITEGYKAKLAVEQNVCTKSAEKIIGAKITF